MKEKFMALLARAQALKTPLDQKREAQHADLNVLLDEYRPREQAIRDEIKANNALIIPVDKLMVSIAKSKENKGEIGEEILVLLTKKVEEMEVSNGNV